MSLPVVASFVWTYVTGIGDERKDGSMLDMLPFYDDDDDLDTLPIGTCGGCGAYGAPGATHIRGGEECGEFV